MPAIPKPQRIADAIKAMQAHMNKDDFNDRYINQEEDADVLKAIIASEFATADTLLLIAKKHPRFHFHANSDVLKAIMAREDLLNKAILVAVANNHDANLDILTDIMNHDVFLDSSVLAAVANNHYANLEILTRIMDRPGFEEEYDVFPVVARNQNASTKMLRRLMNLDTGFRTLITVANNRNIDKVLYDKIMAAFTILASEEHTELGMMLSILQAIEKCSNFIPNPTEFFLAMAKTVVDKVFDPRVFNGDRGTVKIADLKEHSAYAWRAEKILTAIASHPMATNAVFIAIMSTYKEWLNDELLAAIASNQRIFDKHIHMFAAIATNPQAGIETFKAILKRTIEPSVIAAIMKNNNCTDAIFASIVSKTKDPQVLLAVAMNPRAEHEAIYNILRSDQITVELLKTIIANPMMTNPDNGHAKNSHLTVRSLLNDVSSRLLLADAKETLKAIIANPNTDAITLRNIAYRMTDTDMMDQKPALMMIFDDPRSDAETLTAVAERTSNPALLLAVVNDARSNAKTFKAIAQNPALNKDTYAAIMKNQLIGDDVKALATKRIKDPNWDAGKVPSIRFGSDRF